MPAIFPNACGRYVDKWLARHRFLSLVSQGNSTAARVPVNLRCAELLRARIHLSRVTQGFLQRGESIRRCKTRLVELRSER